MAEHTERHEPLSEELAAVQVVIREKEKVVERYRVDYEACTLSAERYQDRADELMDELLSLRSRAAQLTDATSEGADTTPDGVRFASRRTGWS